MTLKLRDKERLKVKGGKPRCHADAPILNQTR